MIDIYKDGLYLNAKSPQELGRTDWHHNPEGQVDYIPLGTGSHKRGAIPLEEQKYDFDYEQKREIAATNLATTKSKYPDWDEYERIMNEYN